MKRILGLTTGLLLMLGVGGSAYASLSVGNDFSSYSQDFDTLTTATGSIAWANDSTLKGWYLFNSTGAAVTNYYSGTGGSNTGAFYSFGTGSDRALGGLGSGGTYFGSPLSGTPAGYIAASFTNTTGASINGFTISFDGEEWRNGGNTSAQTMTLQYGFGNSFSSVSSWITPGGSLNWASPVVGGTAAAVNGNVAGLVSGLGGTIATVWDKDATLWLRWIETNDIGYDHGLAIDNFTLTASPVPVPGAVWLLGSGILAAVGLRRKNS